MTHFCTGSPCLICYPPTPQYYYNPPTAEAVCRTCARRFIVLVTYGEPIQEACGACLRSAESEARKEAERGD